MPNTPRQPHPIRTFPRRRPYLLQAHRLDIHALPHARQSDYAVVYGTVAQDGSGRFAAGGRIRTSPVTRWAAPLAHTHNSVYCLPAGAGCFCDLPATLQPAIDSLGIDPAEAAVILQNAFMQPAHTLPETACFGVPVMRPAGQGDYPSSWSTTSPNCRSIHFGGTAASVLPKA